MAQLHPPGGAAMPAISLRVSSVFKDPLVRCRRFQFASRPRAPARGASVGFADPDRAGHRPASYAAPGMERSATAHKFWISPQNPSVSGSRPKKLGAIASSPSSRRRPACRPSVFGRQSTTHLVRREAAQATRREEDRNLEAFTARVRQASKQLACHPPGGAATQ
jgi:hypothetical protein